MSLAITVLAVTILVGAVLTAIDLVTTALLLVTLAGVSLPVADDCWRVWAAFGSALGRTVVQPAQKIRILRRD